MNKPNDMRQHILDVARNLMTIKGYTAVGLAEVLSNAGVPKGSFYHYFRSKEDFGKALLEEYFSEYISRILPILSAQESGAQCLRRYFEYWVETQGTDVPQQKCLVVKLGPEVCDLSEDMRDVLEKGTARIVNALASCISRGVEDGSITSAIEPNALAEALYQLWLGASLQAKLQKSTKAFETASQAVNCLIH